MKEQEKIEKAMKDIHLLVARSTSMPDNEDMVVVNKRVLFSSLEEINRAMYDMMDRYEVTREARERAERRSKEKCDDMIKESKKISQDIYAAALMYTDDTMKLIYDEVKKSRQEAVKLAEDLANSIDRNLRKVVRDRDDLRKELSEMTSGEDYMRILDRERKRREEGVRTEVTGNGAPSAYHYEPLSMPEDPEWDRPIKVAAPAPLIKVDPAYEEKEEVAEEVAEGVMPSMGPDIKVDYNSAYFQMKRKEAAGSPDELSAMEDFEEGIVEDDGSVAPPLAPTGGTGSIPVVENEPTPQEILGFHVEDLNDFDAEIPGDVPQKAPEPRDDGPEVFLVKK